MERVTSIEFKIQLAWADVADEDQCAIEFIFINQIICAFSWIDDRCVVVVKELIQDVEVLLLELVPFCDNIRFIRDSF